MRKASSIPPVWVAAAFLAGMAAGATLAALFRPVHKAPRIRPVAPAVRQALPPLQVPALSFPPGKGKIAIVLDDWGYSPRHLPILSRISRPLTLAVLPNLPYSDRIAQAARTGGHEVILHMPMEAVDPQEPREEGTILAGMDRIEIRGLLDQALESVPQARGLSNHQGSKATADPQVMEIILQEAKRRRLYFLDSFVTKQSVCRPLARRFKVPFAQRSVFLDNDGSMSAIQERISELAAQAKRHGRAVGIGHDRPATIEALERAIPALEQAGYTLVPVSDLVEKER